MFGERLILKQVVYYMHVYIHCGGALMVPMPVPMHTHTCTVDMSF